MKTKTKSKEPVIDLNTIKILSFKEIEEIFNVTEKALHGVLLKSNYSANFWYPYEENKFSEEETIITIQAFRKKFADMQIINKHGLEYTEFFLNTVEKHVFAYSLIVHFNKHIFNE